MCVGNRPNDMCYRDTNDDEGEAPCRVQDAIKNCLWNDKHPLYIGLIHRLTYSHRQRTTTSSALDSRWRWS